MLLHVQNGSAHDNKCDSDELEQQNFHGYMLTASVQVTVSTIQVTGCDTNMLSARLESTNFPHNHRYVESKRAAIQRVIRVVPRYRFGMSRDSRSVLKIEL